MIESIHIQNFKSIVDLSIELGAFNVIIGENGCGKTNILEAISFAAAANQDHLSNDYLGSKIRMTESRFILPAFRFADPDDLGMVSVSVREKGKIESSISCAYSDKADSWVSFASFQEDLRLSQVIKHFLDNSKYRELSDIIRETSKSGEDMLRKSIEAYDFDKIKDDIAPVYQILADAIIRKPKLNGFLIFCPEESFLRQYDSETQTTPLGQKGQGLFRYLKTLSEKKDIGFFEKLNSYLSAFDWFEGIRFPENSLSNEFKLEIADKYLEESLHYFDQRSSNEGFLYLLFYLTLFISQQTPSFFGVDNIESSFNPKLLERVVSDLIRISKESDKQVIVTTHSPFVLDALDLSDDSIRLFVASRSKDGYTQVKRIPFREGRTLKLSDIWMRGFIGGLPDNF